MSRITLIAVLVLLAAAGCGGDDPEPVAQTKPAAAGMSVPQYEQEVGSIIQTVNDARSDYFNGANDKAAVREQVDAMHSAYTTAVEQLEGVDPPVVARDFQARVVKLWTKRAEQLDKLAGQKPFKPAKVSDLVYGTDRDGYVYDELYALPE